MCIDLLFCDFFVCENLADPSFEITIATSDAIDMTIVATSTAKTNQDVISIDTR